MSREWLYTAISRATNFNNIYFFKYAKDINNELNYNLTLAYFNRKVSGYRAQDRAAKRELSKDNYIKKEWFMTKASNNCGSCGCHFYVKFKEGNAYSNITAQRLDNKSDHNLNNVAPWCNKCNCAAK